MEVFLFMILSVAIVFLIGFADKTHRERQQDRLAKRIAEEIRRTDPAVAAKGKPEVPDNETLGILIEQEKAAKSDLDAIKKLIEEEKAKINRK